MSILLDINMREAPHHKILRGRNPLEYDLRELRAAFDDNYRDGLVELCISNHTEYLTLQFTGILDLIMPPDNLLSSVAVGIFDTSNVPGALAPIRFQHPKCKESVLSFWAKTVTQTALVLATDQHSASTSRAQVFQAGVRSFNITFEVYVILNTFRKYDNKRPDPICFSICFSNGQAAAFYLPSGTTSLPAGICSK